MNAELTMLANLRNCNLPLGTLLISISDPLDAFSPEVSNLSQPLRLCHFSPRISTCDRVAPPHPAHPPLTLTPASLPAGYPQRPRRGAARRQRLRLGGREG